MVEENSVAVEFDVQVASRLHGAVALGSLLVDTGQAGEEGRSTFEAAEERKEPSDLLTSRRRSQSGLTQAGKRSWSCLPVAIQLAKARWCRCHCGDQGWWYGYGCLNVVSCVEGCWIDLP